jgi:hypothetical protein
MWRGWCRPTTAEGRGRRGSPEPVGGAPCGGKEHPLGMGVGGIFDALPLGTATPGDSTQIALGRLLPGLSFEPWLKRAVQPSALPC